MRDGPLSEVEYRDFLNMWLCRFIFCGKANEPTLNHIAMTEDLATGHRIPLGKYLLGSVYHMLHQTTHLMSTSQKISCQRPLVVCADVAATIYAPDCWH
jgi:dethiobiotin synthetase